MKGNYLDMTTKRRVTAGALIILGGAQVPVVGPWITGVLDFQIGPVTVGIIIGAVAVVSGLLLVKKEM